MKILFAVRRSRLPCHVLAGKSDDILGLVGGRLLFHDEARAHHVGTLQLVDRLLFENFFIVRGVVADKLLRLNDSRVAAAARL